MKIGEIRKRSLEYAQTPLSGSQLQSFRRINHVAEVLICWKENGQNRSKTIPWSLSRKTTDASLRKWMRLYFNKLKRGYKPKGFDYPPRPNYCRITKQGKVLAEWYVSPRETEDGCMDACVLRAQTESTAAQKNVRPTYRRGDALGISPGNRTSDDDGVTTLRAPEAAALSVAANR